MLYSSSEHFHAVNDHSIYLKHQQHQQKSFLQSKLVTVILFLFIKNNQQHTFPQAFATSSTTYVCSLNPSPFSVICSSLGEVHHRRLSQGATYLSITLLQLQPCSQRADIASRQRVLGLVESHGQGPHVQPNVPAHFPLHTPNCALRLCIPFLLGPCRPQGEFLKS